jgi:hypothetical protein
MFFVGLRFTTAALLSMLLFRRLLLDLTLREVQAGACVGVAIFFGYALQTLGLGSISSSQSAFITAMYVPIVPFLQWFFLRKPPHLMVWLGGTVRFFRSGAINRPAGHSPYAPPVWGGCNLGQRCGYCDGSCADQPFCLPRH